MFGDSHRPGYASDEPTMLTDEQQVLLRELGRNWIEMFLTEHSAMNKLDGKRQEALQIMGNLQNFIVTVLCCHIWNETGRFTMLCRTQLNDFMLLHGIDGLWEEQQSYPFVVFGTTRL